MRRLSQEHVSLIATRARALAEPGSRPHTRAAFPRRSGGGATRGRPRHAAIHRIEHLQVLFRAGLVGRRRSASAVIYSIAAAELIAWCSYIAHRQLAGSTAHDDAVPCMNFSRAAGSFRAAHRREPRYRREAR